MYLDNVYFCVTYLSPYLTVIRSFDLTKLIFSDQQYYLKRLKVIQNKPHYTCILRNLSMVTNSLISGTDSARLGSNYYFRVYLLPYSISFYCRKATLPHEHSNGMTQHLCCVSPSIPLPMGLKTGNALVTPLVWRVSMSIIAYQQAIYARLPPI